jgi:hypothetical protein
MSISYNYFLPTNIYGTLRVTDLGIPGYTAVNANIYCQRNINSDGQMQCGSFKSLGASSFDHVPTCIIDATTATQLTNLQTVQGLITASGGITAQQAIDAVHASSQQFTVPQNIWNTLTFRTAGGSTSSTVLTHADLNGYFILSNTASTGTYRFLLNTANVQSTVLEMSGSTCILRSGTVQLNLTTVNALTCSNNATFNGAYPTTTLGSNSGLNNNEFATVGYAKSIGGTSILGLNNTFTGTNTFNIPIISSGASITSNTIPSLSLVNNSITNSQIATGFQLISTGTQTFLGIKTLSSLLNSTGITDTVSISTPAINTGLITNPSSTLPIAITFPLGAIPLSTTTTGDPRNGFLLGWNGLSGSNGETDFTNLNQGGNQGGFLFNNIPTGGSLNKLASLLPLNGEGLRLYSYCGQLRLDDTNNGAFNTQLIQSNNQLFINSRGINTQLVLQCGNSTAVTTNSLTLSSSTVSPQVNLNPISTTTFNAFHPTTTLGNNISTNTTQYATVGYVNGAIPASLLGSNNTWTGTNAFNTSIPTTTLTPSTSTQFATVGYVTSAIPASLLATNNVWTGTNEYKNTTNGIKTTAFGTLTSQYFGSGTGGSTNLVIGGNSLSTINILNASNIAICPSPSACLGPNIGNSNIALGTSCGINQSNANQNIFIGTTCGNAVTSGSNNICLGSNAGNGVTTGSNNTVIGNSAWATTANFSNCTVIGASAPTPISSNSIVVGSTAETIYIAGASQINNTLMTGTTVVSNNIQVNGNIIRPILSFTTGVQNTFTTIPPYILYTPAVGQGFVLPAPSASNAGMQFVIRRVAAGSGSTIIFSCTGNPLVWVILNGTVGTASFAVASLGASQSMWFSSGTLFYQLI